jgi:hypothetical protein
MASGSDGVGDPNTAQRLIAWAGLIFVYLSALAFGCIALLLVMGRTRDAFSQYIPELIIFAAGILSAMLGVNLLRAVGLTTSAPRPVIDPGEWADLKRKVVDGNEDAVTQYVRLRSLSGFTGIFTKLGLQGLPLATIGLTLFFSLMFLHDKEYLELAKLTLGAFIGSFVQKQVTDRQAGAGTVQLPSGEKIKVRGSSPNPVA